MAGQFLNQGLTSRMASNKQADALNFYSELPTDQVIYTKSDKVIWSAAQTYVYTTGLDDYCLPIATYSLDGQKWFNQGGFDDTGVYSFANPTVSDDGVITISQSAPSSTKTLYIRIMCLAHPNQKLFNQAATGSAISYFSNYNYRKIAVMDVINTSITSGLEDSFIQDIPHDLGYTPNYMIFARLQSADTFITTILSPNARPKISIDAQKLHFDNYMTNPLVQLQAFQYFYIIYYD